ncbi:metallophosphoesterase family protein [Roseivivax marinus]|uniref:metallophosphoesterase family protein n=1 Tax=Roseivivax marinus TaxID=1379903 RepID=UPI00273E9FCD|nr:metallophosphoesterase [Roseivivax marinus]
MTDILIYGDPHGRWEPLHAAIETRPRAVIVLGDLAEGRDPDGPPRARAAFDAVLASGLQLAFITGNHDAASDDLWSVIEDYDNHRIDGRVIEIDGLRIAGLGGVIRGRLWPGEGEPSYATVAEWIARTPRQERWRGGIPKSHRTSILPWTVESLRNEKADILVTHEAPPPHAHGFQFLNSLAADMGARAIVHGHHHQTYSDVTEDGIRVQGVGLARIWRLPDEFVGKVKTLRRLENEVEDEGLALNRFRRF